MLLALVSLLWLPRLNGTIDLRYDAGVYYILGSSLADGKGYALLNEPGDAAAIQYPPLLPALVAVEQLWLGSDDPRIVGPWLRITFYLISLLYVSATYLMARQFVSWLPATVVGAITGLQFNTYFLADLLFAEVPFALLTVLFVILLRRRQTAVRFVTTAIVGVAAFLVRTAGVALLAAWVLEAVIAKKWRQVALRTAVLLLPVIGWQGYISSVTSSEEYLHPAYPYQRAAYQYYNVSYGENVMLVDPFAPELGHVSVGGLVERFFSNTTAIPAAIGESVSAISGHWVQLMVAASNSSGTGVFSAGEQGCEEAQPYASVLIVLLSGLVLGGYVVLLLRRHWFVTIYIACYVGLVCLTPWPSQFNRYLSPLTPFLALALVHLPIGLRQHALRHWSLRGQRITLALSAAVIAGVLGLQAFSVMRVRRTYLSSEPVRWVRGGGSEARFFFHGPPWRAFDESLAWLAQHAEPDSVVATTAPHWAYLQTGLKSILPPMELDTDLAQQLLDSVPVRYVIADQHVFLDTAKYIAGAVRANPDAWRLVHTASDGATRVYQRVD